MGCTHFFERFAWTRSKSATLRSTVDGVGFPGEFNSHADCTSLRCKGTDKFFESLPQNLAVTSCHFFGAGGLVLIPLAAWHCSVGAGAASLLTLCLIMNFQEVVVCSLLTKDDEDDEDEFICRKVTGEIPLWLSQEIAGRHRDQSGAFTIMAALAAYRHLLRSTRIAFQGMASSLSIIIPSNRLQEITHFSLLLFFKPVQDSTRTAC